MAKKIQIVIWIIIAVIAFLALGGLVYNLARAVHEEPVHPVVTFEIMNLGTIKMELYQEYAPNTVANIIRLVEEGYYKDKTIYGKDANFLHFGGNLDGKLEIPLASLIRKDIQAGNDSDFSYTIPGEFVANGYSYNELLHEKGVVTLLRENYGSALLQESYDSGVSRMGIVMADYAPNHNGNYAAFGKITEGLNLLENVYNTQEVIPAEVDETTGEPIERSVEEFRVKLVVSSATVEKYGIDFGDPEIVEWFNYDEYVYQMFNLQYGS